MIIKLATRRSPLAMIQARILIDSVSKARPDVTFEIVEFDTAGDRSARTNAPLESGKGMFIVELEAAIKRGDVDIAVHSTKDAPSAMDSDVPLVAFSAREDPLDCLLLPSFREDVDYSLPFGCSGARRRVQLANLYPGATFEHIRGNVGTRLSKLESGQYAATALACAGLKRMGLFHLAHRVFTPLEMVPAAGQGILAVQARADFDVSLLEGFSDPLGESCAIAERAFVAACGGDCSSPIGAFAEVDGSSARFTGFLASEDGSISFSEIITGDADKLVRMAELTASKLVGKTGRK